jgi:hypothetical protein
MANDKSCLTCVFCKEERGEFSMLLARWCSMNYYPLQAGGIGGCKAHLTKRVPDAGDSAASTSILQAPALSASEELPTPPTRG